MHVFERLYTFIIYVIYNSSSLYTYAMSLCTLIGEQVYSLYISVIHRTYV